MAEYTGNGVVQYNGSDLFIINSLFLGSDVKREDNYSWSLVNKLPHITFKGEDTGLKINDYKLPLKLYLIFNMGKDSFSSDFAGYIIERYDYSLKIQITEPFKIK